MQRRDRSCARLFGAAVAAVCGVFGAAPSMTAQGTAVASCDRFLLAPREAGGRRVGPASCRSVETPLVVEGRALVRLDVGLDGTIEGYMPTNAPDLVFLQAADAGPRVFTVATYERDKGAAMTTIFRATRARGTARCGSPRTDAGLHLRPFAAGRRLHRRATDLNTATGKPGLDMFQI